jgi:hypothetical protein
MLRVFTKNFWEGEWEKTKASWKASWWLRQYDPVDLVSKVKEYDAALKRTAILESENKALMDELKNRIIKEEEEQKARKIRWFTPEKLEDEREGVSVQAMQVWSESDGPKHDHCWHMTETKNSHRNALELKSSDKHYDYVCCRCTHMLCHTGTIPEWLKHHPIRENHSDRKVAHGKQAAT